MSEIQKGVNELRHLDMRMQIKKGIQQCYILNDSYSNDIHSLQLALTYATQQAGALPITLILSDIDQLNQEAVQYDDLLRQLAVFPIKKLITIGAQLAKVLKVPAFLH
jgi:alanine racemase